VNAWLARLVVKLEAERPDAVLLHYSVFSYAHRGVPLFVHPMLRALRRTASRDRDAPRVRLPWNYGGRRASCGP